MEKPDVKFYKGFTLHKCWCGYPEMRWMIFRADKWRGTSKTLEQAKRKCDFFIMNFAI